jgi:hypothetical protein
MENRNDPPPNYEVYETQFANGSSHWMVTEQLSWARMTPAVWFDTREEIVEFAWKEYDHRQQRMREAE